MAAPVPNKRISNTVTRKVRQAEFRSKLVMCDSVSAGCRRLRLLVIVGLAVVWGGLLVSRLYSLQVKDFERWQEWAMKQHLGNVEIASERGPVLDRNGKMLAVSVPAGSIYARPRQITDKRSAAKQLASVLGMKTSVVAAKLDSQQPFVWIKRQQPRAVASKILDLKLAGVGSIMESKRFYPYNQVASALIGKVGVDGRGLSGVEAIHERRLHVEHVNAAVTRDAFGNVIQAHEDFVIPRGDSVQLTIDADLQMIMDEEVEAGRRAANAKQAMAVMIDSVTGEVLALSQSPSYNFNVPTHHSKNELKNLLVEAVFEPGSTMKPLVAAAALEEKVVGTKELVNCEKGRFPFSKHVIKDVHPSGTISFRDVIVRSSNIGMTKVGIRLGSERLHDYLERFGFGSTSGLRLPGESGGILRPLSKWAKVDVATHAFGQGIAVTPLQMVRAMSALANGGVLPKLSMIIDETDHVGTRVVSRRSADAVREMLYAVVEDEHGTGGKAAIPGLRVGGKTGTAQKANPAGRGYAPGAYLASFVGFVDGAPLGVKRVFSTIVMIDEPKTTSIYGGTLAAPVFQRVMERSIKFLANRNDLKDPIHPRYLQKSGGPKLVTAGFTFGG